MCIGVYGYMGTMIHGWLGSYVAGLFLLYLFLFFNFGDMTMANQDFPAPIQTGVAVPYPPVHSNKAP